MKNRYDFFVYCHGASFGIDIFTTQRIEYIGPNIRHKLKKYRDVSRDTTIYFIVFSEHLTSADVHKGAATALELKNMPNIKVTHLNEFLASLPSFIALPLPDGFTSAIE